MLTTYTQVGNVYKKNNITVILSDMAKIEFYRKGKLNIILCDKDNLEYQLRRVERLVSNETTKD